MLKANLKQFTKPGLDVLFVSLNPPIESNENGHYFSGKNSRFFELLFLSNLIKHEVDKSIADDLIFGCNASNYNKSSFGIIDLVPNVVKTDSHKVKPTDEHVKKLVKEIKNLKPRFVCIIHSKVRNALNKARKTIPEIQRDLEYGKFDDILRDCSSVFMSTYFPNGNNINDKIKLGHLKMLRKKLC